MLEKALKGGKLYWAWVAILLVFIGIGVAAYINQFNYGLGLTGMSRDVNWGLYISQFTFMVGIAASGVMVAIPLYLHNFRTYGKIVIFGEFMAVAAIVVALLFVLADLGYPTRVFNVILYPSPHAMLFWDMCVLSSYLLVNILIGWTVLGAERKGVKAPKWCRILAIISIPLAFSIHTVTAFLIAGLPGRYFWMTAIMAPRFLASAFAAGPAVLIVVCMIMRRFSTFKVTDKAIDALAKTVCYAMIANVFFFLLEIFTAFYSNVPSHKASLIYLFAGLDGENQLVPFMWTAVVLAFVGLFLLLVPKMRKNLKVLPVALICVFLACWIDKGLGLILAGYVPNSFEEVINYIPNPNEICVIIGIYAIGFFVLTILYKIAVAVNETGIAFDHSEEYERKLEEAGGEH